MLVVFIIDSLNSLIVKNFTQNSILKKILIKVSNPIFKLFSRYFSKLFYGGSSLTAEYETVDLEERVRFPPAALIKTTKYINQKPTR